MNAKDSFGWTPLSTLVQMDTKMSSNRFKKPFLVIGSRFGQHYFFHVRKVANFSYCVPRVVIVDGNRLTNIRTGHCDLLVFVDDLRQQESCIL